MQTSTGHPFDDPTLPPAAKRSAPDPDLVSFEPDFPAVADLLTTEELTLASGALPAAAESPDPSVDEVSAVLRELYQVMQLRMHGVALRSVGATNRAFPRRDVWALVEHGESRERPIPNVHNMPSVVSTLRQLLPYFEAVTLQVARCVAKIEADEAAQAQVAEAATAVRREWELRRRRLLAARKA